MEVCDIILCFVIMEVFMVVMDNKCYMFDVDL